MVSDCLAELQGHPKEMNRETHLEPTLGSSPKLSCSSHSAVTVGNPKAPPKFNKYRLFRLASPGYFYFWGHSDVFLGACRTGDGTWDFGRKECTQTIPG